MTKRTWLPAKPKRQPKPKVPNEIRQAVDAQLASIVAKLKQQFCKKPKNPQFNRPADVFARWYRNALYFVVVMRTSRGRPSTFKTRAARMEHAGGGRFNLAVPMRRGWNTVKKVASPQECLKEVTALVCF